MNRSHRIDPLYITIKILKWTSVLNIHFPNVRGPASFGALLFMRFPCPGAAAERRVLTSAGATRWEKEGPRKNCVMENEKKWNNEKRKWDWEKPGEQFLYQDPERHDPVICRLPVFCEAPRLVHNVSLMLYQTSATAALTAQIKCPRRRWVPVVCLDCLRGTVTINTTVVIGQMHRSVPASPSPWSHESNRSQTAPTHGSQSSSITKYWIQCHYAKLENNVSFVKCAKWGLEPL